MRFNRNMMSYPLPDLIKGVRLQAIGRRCNLQKKEFCEDVLMSCPVALVVSVAADRLK